MIQGFSHQTMALEEGIDSLFRFIGFAAGFLRSTLRPYKRSVHIRIKNAAYGSWGFVSLLMLIKI